MTRVGKTVLPDGTVVAEGQDYELRNDQWFEVGKPYAWTDDAKSSKLGARLEPAKPLFLYFASPTVHMPMQTPPLAEDGWWTEKLKAIANIERRAFAAATVATDNVAGDVVDVLRETNHWDDTVSVSYTHLTLPTKA